MKKGICNECETSLSSPTSTGYCLKCAEIVHARERKERVKKYPFVVDNGYGHELERFETRHEADEYLWAMKNAEIRNLND